LTAPAVPASTPATTGEMSRIPGLKTHRNAELALLTFAMILVAVYGATVEANQLGDVSPTFWVPAALLSVLFLGLHLVVRFTAPYADPVLIPAVALINGLGVGFLRRLDLARAIALKQPEPGEALAAAVALAHDLSRLPQTCMRMDRQSAYEQWDLPFDAAMVNELARGRTSMRAPDQAVARFVAGEGRHGS